MTVPEILAALQSLGVTIAHTPHGPRMTGPVDKVKPELMDACKAHRQELLDAFGVVWPRPDGEYTQAQIEKWVEEGDEAAQRILERIKVDSP
jgi:hypothetical protein